MDKNMKKTKTAAKPKSNKKAPAAGKTAAGKKVYQTPRIEIDKGGKVLPKDEFRFNHVAKHTNYIFGETAEQYKAVGLTHRGATFGRGNMPLNVNPKKGDEAPSYARNGIITEDKRSYSKKIAKNFQFSKDDKANVKSKIRHYKKEQKHKISILKKAQKKE